MSLRIGFVGAGGIAGRHLRNLSGFADARVVAAADPAEGRAQAFLGAAGGAAYEDWRAMLDREALDALYVCTPPFAHGEPEIEAARRRLPFFVEKPLSADAETAETIASAVATAGLVTAVGYHWRYLDTVEQARAILAQRPARLVTGYWLDSTPPPGWWRRRDQSGGQFVEQTTHVFDLARLLVGEVEEVFAAAGRTERAAWPDCDVAEASAATLRFASGAVGSVTSTCLLTWPHRIGLNLFGDDLALELTERAMAVRGAPGTFERDAQGDPFVREDRDFIDAVAGAPDRVRTPYTEAMRTHRLVHAAARSADERRPVRPEPAPSHV